MSGFWFCIIYIISVMTLSVLIHNICDFFYKKFLHSKIWDIGFYIRQLNFETYTFTKLYLHSDAARPSISMPEIVALHRCAIMRAIRPVPQPMSKADWVSLTLAQAPMSTPSVPTFIALM